MQFAQNCKLHESLNKAKTRITQKCELQQTVNYIEAKTKSKSANYTKAWIMQNCKIMKVWITQKSELLKSANNAKAWIT